MNEEHRLAITSGRLGDDASARWLMHRAIEVRERLGYITAEKAARGHEEVEALIAKQLAKEEMMKKLTERDLFLMNRAFAAGDANGASNSENKGRRYTLHEWLQEGIVIPTSPGARGFHVTREEYLVAHAPEEPDE